MELIRALHGEGESPVLLQPNAYQWSRRLLGAKGVVQRTEDPDNYLSTRKRNRPGSRAYNF
jgi:hypothetical protein